MVNMRMPLYYAVPFGLFEEYANNLFYSEINSILRSWDGIHSSKLHTFVMQTILCWNEYLSTYMYLVPIRLPSMLKI